MTDFNKVINDAFRMCANTSNCNECLIAEKCIQKTGFTKENILSFEETVEKWAIKNPFSDYPSWRDYWTAMFPGMTDFPCPKANFGVNVSCGDLDCDTECLASPIPEHIAKKLGIKTPKGRENNGE